MPAGKVAISTHKNYGKIENLSEFDLEKYFPFKILENILQPKI
jgi:hypothetical protein